MGSPGQAPPLASSLTPRLALATAVQSLPCSGWFTQADHHVPSTPWVLWGLSDFIKASSTFPKPLQPSLDPPQVDGLLTALSCSWALEPLVLIPVLVEEGIGQEGFTGRWQKLRTGRPVGVHQKRGEVHPGRKNMWAKARR